MSVAAANIDPITEEQLRLRKAYPPRSAEDFFATARWWELEAARGYPSSRRSLLYATNMLHAAQARLADGTTRWWSRDRDVVCRACSTCSGPVSGPFGCGGCSP